MATSVASHRKQRPGGRELAALVARQQQPRKHSAAVANRLEAFTAIQTKLRATGTLNAAQALEAAYGFTSLRHAQMADRQSKSAVKLWEAMGALADRAFSRITELEKTVAELRGHDAQPETRALKGEGDRVELELRGEVTRSKCDALIAKISAASPRDEICLRLTSPGGDHGASVDLAEALIAHKGKVRCVAEGQCASAATTILAAADRDARLATPDATFLIHKGQGAPAHWSPDFTAGAEHADSEYLARWFSKRTGKSWFTYRKMLREDGPSFDVARARELGLVSDILPSPTRTRRSSKAKRKGKRK